MPSIREHCCGADRFFDRIKADKQYRQYLKKGARKATAALINQLSVLDINGKTLVDIGGGIGALQWWFLQQGGQRTIDIDASSGYLQIAREHAIRQGWQGKTDFLEGDCTEILPQLDEVDIVTLDKVICCYPDYREILAATCQKATTCIALTYPMDGPLAQAVRNLGVLFFKLRGNPFRPYVHRVAEVRQILAEHGFKRHQHQLVFPWHAETYLRES